MVEKKSSHFGTINAKCMHYTELEARSRGCVATGVAKSEEEGKFTRDVQYSIQ
jgi:hypothetical protein